MKILFIYPDINIDPHYGGYDYLGIAYLSAVLKREGFETSLLHIKKPITDGEFIRQVQDKSPDLVAFTSTTNMMLFVKKWVKALKESRDLMTILGGIHATLQPEESIEIEGIDMICVGEGEGAILDVCRRLAKKDFNLSDIPNIWFKRGAAIYKNNPRPLFENLDLLPFPDRDIYNYSDLDTYRIFATRGCPYDCSYCFNRSYYRDTYRHSSFQVRFRSPENIIEELEYALKKYSTIRTVHFVDDTLPLRTDMLTSLTSLYKQRINLPYIAQTRPNLASEKVVKMLKESNCYQLQIGIESGNDYIRNSILKRNISKKQIEDAFGLAKKYKLKTYSYNMVGIPFETKESIMETLKLNAMCDIDLYHTSFYYPYPKTELEAICRREGLMQKEWNIDYFTDTILKFDYLTKEFIFFIRRFFVPLARAYTIIYKLPAWIRPVVITISDIVITNPIFYIAINQLRLIFMKIRNTIRKIRGNLGPLNFSNF